MSLIRNLLDTVSNNLISGNAYYLIIKSIFVTLIITGVAFIIAFVFGGLVSYFMCYKRRVISGIAQGICFIFRSVPAVLLLLLFYYVFYKSFPINNILLVGVTIGCYGAGHFAEIITHSVKKAQRRQEEAVTARLKHMFYTVAMPQALEEAWFPIKRLAVQLLQWTVIAGYIRVNDLTAVMGKIGQRTMYPFFSIFCCIIFYLVLTAIIELFFHVLSKHFVPEEIEHE